MFKEQNILLKEKNEIMSGCRQPKKYLLRFFESGQKKHTCIYVYMSDLNNISMQTFDII